MSNLPLYLVRPDRHIAACRFDRDLGELPDLMRHAVGFAVKRLSILAGELRRNIRRGVGLPRPLREEAIRRAEQAHAPPEITRKDGEPVKSGY